MFDIVTQKLCNPVHHLKHSRDDFFQNFRFFADDLIRDFVCQRQNAPQPIQQYRRDLVIFVSFLQELNWPVLSLLLVRQWPARTSNMPLATPKIAFEIGFN